MANFGVHNFPFSKVLMQISPSKGKRQEEYLNPKITSFQIMKCALI